MSISHPADLRTRNRERAQAALLAAMEDPADCARLSMFVGHGADERPFVLVRVPGASPHAHDPVYLCGLDQLEASAAHSTPNGFDGLEEMLTRASMGPMDLEATFPVVGDHHRAAARIAQELFASLQEQVESFAFPLLLQGAPPDDVRARARAYATQLTREHLPETPAVADPHTGSRKGNKSRGKRKPHRK